MTARAVGTALCCALVACAHSHMPATVPAPASAQEIHSSSQGSAEAEPADFGGLPYVPTAAYERRKIRGHEILVSPEAKEHPNELAVGLALLESKFIQIEQRLGPRIPAAKMAPIASIPVWIEWRTPGNEKSGEYHRDAQFLREHGKNPEMAHAIDIPNLEYFIDSCVANQPLVFFHELAHAYEQLVLHDSYAPLFDAYDHAIKAGLYADVPFILGGRTRAYAISDPQEYFAVLTESFFGQSDTYPFVRSELAEYDPTGYAMIDGAWR